MKNINIIKQTTVLLALGLICCAGTLYAQDGKKKDFHRETRNVTKHGKDSTVTINKIDITNGQTVKKTLVIHNGDTTSNIIIEKTNSGIENHSNIIINGDSIVKILKISPNRNNKNSVIILNGDSILTQTDGEGLKITIDTAKISESLKNNKSFKDATNKGFTMNDKYIIINMNKFKHKDSSNTKLPAGTFIIGLVGFDLGFTQFIDNNSFGVSPANSLLDLNVGKSVNVNFRVVDTKINLVQHHLYLNAGLEFDLHDYRFTHNVTIKPNSDVFTPIDDKTAHFSKDKLSTQYLELPVMLFVNTNPRHSNKAFRIGAGGYYGILLGSYTKQISAENGKQHYYGDFQCNPIDYGAMAVIGYGHVDLFAKYNMSSVFDTNKGGPNLQSITFGVKLFHPFGWKS
jgi:hypothetical protein